MPTADPGNSAVSGPLADLDGDGLVTLLEFALNLISNSRTRANLVGTNGTRGLPLIRREQVDGFSHLIAEFVRRRAAGAPGISYRAEFASELGNPAAWTPSPAAAESVTPIDETWERVKVNDPTPPPRSTLDVLWRRRIPKLPDDPPL